ncbi:KH domain-containing, RNA-binding, signal transduction-associated protein 2 isoform X2 [Diabrotica virgifera virgifera]|uniref:KH domain-containing, RNA-binding, signal transduction-associated protein 2 isoform X2 n=1 Tax=Diabrotica virgifera virgifera TaxID=50390 RepID=A0A6P7EZ97_DIAVI|nr:KH domain-containing, RNA-binding, signal transduction-associated protein 2 isoform X2 [Diabrotica virgifera virgifera]
MTDKYNSNGEDYYGDKRKGGEESIKRDSEAAGDNEENTSSQRASEYVKELLAEKLSIDQHKLPNAVRLLEQEVTKTQSIGRAPVRDIKYVDIYREKPIKVTVKVLVPVREYPKFNFVGKLLGPKGNSMKRLQEETMCKMAVLGRGSMKDRAKEDELRNSLDPKYSHLMDDLHVEISALGPPAEAHARVAFALAEVRKYLIPDSNDNIRQEQLREMELFSDREMIPEPRRPPPPHHIRPSNPISRGPPPPHAMRTATRAPVHTPRVMPAKTKIMSILDRARVAMEESYGYEDDYGATSPPRYGNMYAPKVNDYTSGYYEDYETDYYKDNGSPSFDYHRRGFSHQSGPRRQQNSKQSNHYNSSPSKKVG